MIREALDADDFAVDQPNLYAPTTDPSPPWDGVSKIWAWDGVGPPVASPPETPVAWPDPPLKVQTSAGGALDGYGYAELDGNIRIAVPADWAAGEVGTVALEWAPQGGSQRLVAYVEASYDSAPPPFGSVNIVKFEVQTGNGP